MNFHRFMKLGSGSVQKGHDNSNSDEYNSDENNPKSENLGSWRQAIFNRITQKLEDESTDEFGDSGN